MQKIWTIEGRHIFDFHGSVSNRKTVFLTRYAAAEMI